MQNEPWPPSLAALRTPLYSLSNKVLTWGKQSLELNPYKRHLGWCRLQSRLDKEASALLQDSSLCPALTPRHKRQSKGTAGGTKLESHLTLDSGKLTSPPGKASAMSFKSTCFPSTTPYLNVQRGRQWNCQWNFLFCSTQIPSSCLQNNGANLLAFLLK